MSKRKRAAKQQARSQQKVKSGVQQRDSRAKHSQPQPAQHRSKNRTPVLSYDDSQHILCIGEGNFSFARAVVRLLEYSGLNVVATAYDAEETVSLKYEVGQ